MSFRSSEDLNTWEYNPPGQRSHSDKNRVSILQDSAKNMLHLIKIYLFGFSLTETAVATCFLTKCVTDETETEIWNKRQSSFPQYQNCDNLWSPKSKGCNNKMKRSSEEQWYYLTLVQTLRGTCRGRIRWPCWKYPSSHCLCRQILAVSSGFLHPDASSLLSWLLT